MAKKLERRLAVIMERIHKTITDKAAKKAHRKVFMIGDKGDTTL
jgi:hypothetical protein